MKRYEIGSSFSHTVRMERSDLALASERAFHMVMAMLGEKDGRLEGVVGFERSTDSVEIKLAGYQMDCDQMGVTHVYEFEVCLVRNDEETGEPLKPGFAKRLHDLVDQWADEDSKGMDVLASEWIDRIRDVLNEIQGTDYHMDDDPNYPLNMDDDRELSALRLSIERGDQ